MVLRRLSSQQQLSKAEKALLAFLRAIAPKGDQYEQQKTAQRTSSLWLNELLWGQGQDLATLLGKGLKSKQKNPVCMTSIGIYMVCPHHLTIAMGEVHIAYLPNGRLIGFSKLTALARAVTSRMILQEDATQIIAETLYEVVGVKACFVQMQATHPCHHILEPRAHHAVSVCWGQKGSKKDCNVLRRHLKEALLAIKKCPQRQR